LSPGSKIHALTCINIVQERSPPPYPVIVLSRLVLLATGACGILLGYMADEEASGKRIFRAESPFADVSVSEAPVESVKYLRAA